MRYLKSATFILILILVASCKKEEKPEVKTDPQPVVYPNYTQLKPGNYWIHQIYEIDTLGNATALDYFDSMYVLKETVLNNKTYAELHTEGALAIKPVQFLRDSLHYLVNEQGEILYSSEDFNHVLNTYYPLAGQGDTICKVEVKMADKDKMITVAAGTFKTSSTQSTYYFYPNWQMAGKTRYANVRYAEGIGLVSESLILGVMDPSYNERRLLRYKAE